MRNWLLPVAVALSACVFSATAADGREVWLVDLEGTVGPASADLVIRAIEDAADANAQAVIVRMDTPGGLDKSMRDMVKAILGSRIPVITYVSPGGARAASAGTYIAYASHIAAMAPATNIGSSTPVSIAPTAPSVPGGGDEEKPSPVDAMTKKVVNDAVAYLQSLAELRDRNIEWAEETVREGANLRASAALEQNVIDIVAADLGTLLEEIDGREVEVGNATQVLATAGAAIVQVETDWRHELLSVITDPSIAYGLLIIGVYGLILEFYNPGMIFPAVTGVICLLMGAYGLQMLPVNYAGLALIVVGIGLMVAEVMTPAFGVLGVGGVAAFVIGSIMLLDSDVPGYQLPIPIILGFAVATGGVAFFVVGTAIQARRQKIVSGVEGMVGADALVLDDFEGHGSVRAFGEIWAAHSDVPLQKDMTVRVTSVDGLTLTVEPED